MCLLQCPHDHLPRCCSPRRSCHPLLSQAVQGISFFSFVEEYGSGAEPYEWYTRALPYMSPCQAPEDVMALDSCREPVSIAPPRRGLLQPPRACMHRWGWQSTDGA